MSEWGRALCGNESILLEMRGPCVGCPGVLILRIETRRMWQICLDTDSDTQPRGCPATTTCGSRQHVACPSGTDERGSHTCARDVRDNTWGPNGTPGIRVGARDTQEIREGHLRRVNDGYPACHHVSHQPVVIPRTSKRKRRHLHRPTAPVARSSPQPPANGHGLELQKAARHGEVIQRPPAWETHMSHARRPRRRAKRARAHRVL